MIKRHTPTEARNMSDYSTLNLAAMELELTSASAYLSI